MTTLLREMYEVLGCFSTATHLSMCDDLIAQLKKGKRKTGNLSGHFAKALTANQDSISQVDVPFVPEGRNAEKKGTNPVTHIMRQLNCIHVSLPDSRKYKFKYLEREIPHLRAKNAEEQNDTAWIDYVARTNSTPILGEIKWKGDKNPFYGFIQLLVYLSEMATPNQIARASKHQLFGQDQIEPFDLHIFLVNFNEQSEKSKLISKTHELAELFKKRLFNDYPEIAKCLGNVLCISAKVDEETEKCFDSLSCLWIVEANVC